LHARVVANEPCPPIAAGPGSVVLTTVNHLNPDVYSLALADAEGRGETVRPTGLHKFYSADRGHWVNTEELKAGERLRGIDGWLTVTDVRRLPGVHRVYNMTVAGEHVFHVSRLGLVSHNNNPCAQAVPDAPRKAATPKTNAQLRAEWEEVNQKPWPKDPVTGRNQDVSHTVPKADGGANSLENIEPLPHAEHMQRHIDAGDFKRWGARGGRKP